MSDDTSGASFTCTVDYGGSFVGSSVSVRKDSSPPSVNGTVSRDPDSDGWYTKPVDVGFGGRRQPVWARGLLGGSGLRRPDGGAVTLAGTCSDNAGNSASASITIKYDGTPPGISAAPSRAPDVNGWYNHPVDVAFSGTDAGSG